MRDDDQEGPCTAVAGAWGRDVLSVLSRMWCEIRRRCRCVHRRCKARFAWVGANASSRERHQAVPKNRRIAQSWRYFGSTCLRGSRYFQFVAITCSTRASNSSSDQPVQTERSRAIVVTRNLASSCSRSGLSESSEVRVFMRVIMDWGLMLVNRPELTPSFVRPKSQGSIFRASLISESTIALLDRSSHTY